MVFDINRNLNILAPSIDIVGFEDIVVIRVVVLIALVVANIIENYV